MPAVTPGPDLGALDLLSGVPPSERAALVAVLARRGWAAGETVFGEGDPADAVHLVVAGRLVVRRTTARGDTVAFTVVGPGEAVGELALLRPSGRRTTTVAALEASTTLVLPAAAFERLRARHPGVDRLLVDLLARRVTRLSDHLLDALWSPVEDRVLHRLAELARGYAPRAGTVRLPLTQAELAELAGASRPATNRVLQRLVADGLVRLERGAVTVLDVNRLAT